MGLFSVVNLMKHCMISLDRAAKSCWPSSTPEIYALNLPQFNTIYNYWKNSSTVFCEPVKSMQLGILYHLSVWAQVSWLQRGFNTREAAVFKEAIHKLIPTLPAESYWGSVGGNKGFKVSKSKSYYWVTKKYSNLKNRQNSSTKVNINFLPSLLSTIHAYSTMVNYLFSLLKGYEITHWKP